jgi:hypothetical protein
MAKNENDQKKSKALKHTHIHFSLFSSLPFLLAATVAAATLYRTVGSLLLNYSSVLGLHPLRVKIEIF